MKNKQAVIWGANALSFVTIFLWIATKISEFKGVIMWKFSELWDSYSDLLLLRMHWTVIKK